MNEIKKTTLHPDNQPNTDLYPKTSTDQVEGLNNIITGVNNEIEKKVNTVDNFVRVFTIPNGVSSGTLTADVKEKLCNPDGHNYYVYDDTSEIILKYSFNSENEIIQYKAMYLQINKAYEITMQIFPSNGRWTRSQTVLNVPTSAGGKLYRHEVIIRGSTPEGVPSSFTGVELYGRYYSSTLTKKTIDDFWNHDNGLGLYRMVRNEDGNPKAFYDYSVLNKESHVLGVFFITANGENVIYNQSPTTIVSDDSYTYTISDIVTEL